MILRPGSANLPHRLLKAGLDCLDDGAGAAEVAHQVAERLEPPQVLRRVVAGEFGQQQRGRFPLNEALDNRAEHRDVARQIDHRAVDQLDRAGTELDDPPGCGHRAVEAREMADA